ncbi:2-dehydropantoate 2-reductase [Alkalibaculum sp. M08DMB]|uniref:2-dehydropantoate 2-reductase n=1 Tax=Alkalibaculum sporogenes TaxID=2655001 RepID=A0A6A7K4Q1_9FIRM|nr:2-dehydropantoate 2-reductase [Alkalibaculum sporogenes]MPW24355.1 2-dehydropantoate 2-reductase [Alkalibaculum sporogenes]
MDNTKVLIVGTGAIGSFYGGKLDCAGAQVSTLCRSDYNHIKKSGISVKSVMGDFHFMPYEVINKIEDYSSIPDYILVTTKVLPGIDIQKIIEPKVGKNTAIVLIQNGIDIEKPVREAFPNNEIISGLAFICVSRTSLGEIYHQDYGRLIIGNYPNGLSPKVKYLQSLFIKSEVDCTVDDNIVNSRWKKMIWNAPFNPISVIGGGVDTKTILENSEAKNLVINVMKEVLEIANKSGYNLPETLIQKNIEDTLNMKPYKTSMLLDYENNRPLEVEVILGNAVKIARDLDLSVPNLKALYSLLLLLDKNNI